MKKIICLISFLCVLSNEMSAQNIMRYKWVATYTADGQKIAPYEQLVYYLNFNSSMTSFFICDADGSRSFRNGGFAGVEIPQGGTGIATRGYYPIDYTFQSQNSQGVKTYMDKRPVFIIGSGNRIDFYTYDTFKFSKDFSRLNVKLEHISGRSTTPFLIFGDPSCTYVYELMGNPANNGDIFY